MDVNTYNVDNAIKAVEHIISGISDYHKKKQKELESELLKTRTDINLTKEEKRKKVERLEERLEQLKDSYQKQQPAIQDVRTKLLELKNVGRQAVDYETSSKVSDLLRRIGDEKAIKIFSKEVDQQLARITKVSHELYKELQSKHTKGIQTNVFVQGRENGKIRMRNSEYGSQSLQSSVSRFSEGEFANSAQVKSSQSDTTNNKGLTEEERRRRAFPELETWKKELQTLPANDPKAPLLREAITVGESYADVLMTLRDIDTVLNTLNNRSKTPKTFDYMVQLQRETREERKSLEAKLDDLRNQMGMVLPSAPKRETEKQGEPEVVRTETRTQTEGKPLSKNPSDQEVSRYQEYQKLMREARLYAERSLRERGIYSGSMGYSNLLLEEQEKYLQSKGYSTDVIQKFQNEFESNYGWFSDLQRTVQQTTMDLRSQGIDPSSPTIGNISLAEQETLSRLKTEDVSRLSEQGLMKRKAQIAYMEQKLQIAAKQQVGQVKTDLEKKQEEVRQEKKKLSFFQRLKQERLNRRKQQELQQQQLLQQNDQIEQGGFRR